MIAGRQLRQETALATAAILLLLLLITMAVRLSGYLADAASGRLDPGMLGWLILLRIPDFLLLLTPLAFFVALLLTLARWRRDAELVILYAAGLTPGWLLRSTLLAALPWCLLLVLLSHHAVPASKATLAELMAQQRGVFALGHLTPGRFQVLGGAARVAWVGSVDPDSGRLDDVFLLQQLDGERSLIIARSGRLERSALNGARVLTLADGRRYRIDSIEQAPHSTAFAGSRQQVDPEVAARAVESQRFLELWRGADFGVRAELHWRLLLPLLPALLALLALLLLGRPGTAVPGQRFLMAAGSFLGLLLLLAAGRGLVEAGRLDPAWALWAPLLGIAGAAWLLWSRDGWRGWAWRG
ncbi:MAG: LPS export ABC transporter permease LptF [Gammaproteobacteria bacterium]|nr:MAG: LPS export ABC transporter permease LptF [Gammaproteobacteria bacterium]